LPLTDIGEPDTALRTRLECLEVARLRFALAVEKRFESMDSSYLMGPHA